MAMTHTDTRNLQQKTSLVRHRRASNNFTSSSIVSQHADGRVRILLSTSALVRLIGGDSGIGGEARRVASNAIVRRCQIIRPDNP